MRVRLQSPKADRGLDSEQKWSGRMQ
jgi:hypothetical protein